ncbi:MAG: asparagine synthase (glutamine-hydrolyzing) [candidate division NC10 bacterium]|nr:asparagine synthase (glutamine-hydrolyzing) [candidate division NC10 bacterium]
MNAAHGSPARYVWVWVWLAGLMLISVVLSELPMSKIGIVLVVMTLSSIKAILVAGSVRPAFNMAVLPEYLATRFVSGEETFFQGVRKLLPGRTLTWSLAEGPRTRRYWRLPTGTDDSPRPPGERARELRVRLSQSVRSHLLSDVPLGLFLSGGLDSSGLAALMAPLLEEPVRTFAVGFDEPGANELHYARLVARAVGAEHREVVVSPAEFFQALPQLLWHEDEPIAFPSSVPLYFVSRLAREHVKVVITGEGADELFLGYNRYRVTAWNEGLGRVYRGLIPGALQEDLGRLVGTLPRPLRRYAQRTFLALPPDPRTLFFENFSVFPTALQQALLLNRTLLAHTDPYAEGWRCFRDSSGGILERMQHADLQTYLVELLMKQDQMSMAASIESRVPFLDHEIVEHVVPMPGHLKLKGWQTKAVLREALRDLVPPEILRRRKMGFPVPVGRWLRGPFWCIVQEFVLSARALRRGFFDPSLLRQLAQEHRAGVGEHGDRLWLLANLEIWHRIFLDGEDIASIMRAARAA